MSAHYPHAKLATLSQIINDDRCYIYYDKVRYYEHEREGLFKSFWHLSIRIAGMLISVFIILAAFSVLVCAVKIIPYVSGIWIYVMYGSIAILLIFAALMAYGSIAPVLSKALIRNEIAARIKKLIAKKSKVALTSRDFYGQMLPKLSDAYGSQSNLLGSAGLVLIALWLIVFKDIDFSSLGKFLTWNAILMVDSLTLTAFNLLDRFRVTPNAPDWVMFLLQAYILANGVAAVARVQFTAHQGYKYIRGNKYKARLFYAGLERQCAIFYRNGTMSENALFMEIDTASGQAKRYTLAELDRKILSEGLQLLAEAEPLLDDKGNFTPALFSELDQVLADSAGGPAVGQVGSTA